jgi:two-component system, response regulator PdtaR
MADNPHLGRTVVLVTEDQALIRMFTADFLVDAGYAVIEAGDAAEALKALEDTADVRVLLTDVEMPGEMDGLELAREVQRRWPTMIIIVTSGRVRPAPADLGVDVEFLTKPIREETVVSMIRERLAV